MKYNLFPIGDIMKFEGNISILNENYYWNVLVWYQTCIEQR
jgi:hypothetical protein